MGPSSPGPTLRPSLLLSGRRRQVVQVAGHGAAWPPPAPPPAPSEHNYNKKQRWVKASLLPVETEARNEASRPAVRPPQGDGQSTSQCMSLYRMN
ncbi:unnamed protein product [Natator depressus]